MKLRSCLLLAVLAVPVGSGAAAKPLTADVPGADKSTVPTAKEWLAAEPVELSRLSPAGATCVATRVREWLRVRCPIKTFAISLLGGSNEGLSFWIGGEAEDRPGEVQFPLRRGDRRVVQFWVERSATGGETVIEPGIVVQEHWLAGDPSPTVSVL